MSLSFSYEEHLGHVLKLTTDNGAVVKVHFKDLDSEYVTVDDDFEFMLSDDTLHALYVRIDQQMYSLYQIANDADTQIDGIVREIEQEAKAQADHERFYSCPGRSGRI